MASQKPAPAAMSFRLGELSLNSRFWAAIVIVMACSLALGGGLILHYHEQLEASRANLAKLANFRLIIEAANRISEERGPANRVLGEEPGTEGGSRALLRAARATTDAALAAAAATPEFADGIPALRQSLAQARQRIDALAARPMAARSIAAIADAVGAMFGVYDETQPLIDRGMNVLLADEADLVGPALAMRMLSELRDDAGRLGSYLVIPMVRGEPLGAERRIAFDQTRGRVWELWHLVSQLTTISSDPGVVRAHAAVVTLFMGDGMALLQKTLDESGTGRYSVTPTSFTAAIVPDFATLTALRDAFADATMARLRADAAATQRALIVVASATGFVLLVELLLLLASQNWLFRPLLGARDRIVAFAEGKLGDAIERFHPHGEIRQLYDALASLRGKLIERAALTERFRQQAETDGLTGVFNRRSLDTLAETLTSAGDGSTRIGFIMADIDHFKSINDTYGHAEGDVVLRETAQRLRRALRDGDILARYGGEEFGIILVDHGTDVPEVAERLRQALEQPPFRLGSGQSLQITASFGTAIAALRPGIWPRLAAAADQALYRAKETGRNRVATNDLV